MGEDRISRFRELHAGPGLFVMPNPWDIGSARVLEGLGFAALATTSAGMAFTLGRPDGAVTREEALAHAGAIVEATSVPVSADLENGFGDDPKDVALTIQEAGQIGLAGASIEDYSGALERPIYDLAHAVERIAAAVEAASALGPGFVLTARAENFLHGRPDLDDTLRRLEAFEAAGADVLYAPALPDLAAVRTVCGALKKPVNVLGGLAKDRFTVADLAQAGVRRVSLGSMLARAALGALLRAAREVKHHGTFGFAAVAATSEEIDPFLGRGPG
jgi:2-methylisocitrate lyase-like PEP mutase family enzyme